MIVESPNTFTPRRFELVNLLQLPHDVQISDKDARNHRLLILFLQGPDTAENEQVREEGELVPCPVVEAGAGAKRGAELVRELGEDGVLLRRENRFLKVFLVLAGFEEGSADWRVA